MFTQIVSLLSVFFFIQTQFKGRMNELAHSQQSVSLCGTNRLVTVGTA